MTPNAQGRRYGAAANDPLKGAKVRDRATTDCRRRSVTATGAHGITSAFRDDYRQSIASGLKAATDWSYHGGSFRGG